jgi:hypothetical protein
MTPEKSAYCDSTIRPACKKSDEDELEYEQRFQDFRNDCEEKASSDRTTVSLGSNLLTGNRPRFLFGRSHTEPRPLCCSPLGDLSPASRGGTRWERSGEYATISEAATERPHSAPWTPSVNMETKSFFTESACLIEQGDIAIFKIPSQTAKGDKMSLLSLQNIVRRNVRNYVYLEIGSFMGGTLLPHLADPECRLAYSIDKRPASQPDERGRAYDYAHSSTQEMLATLEKHLPHAAMLKLLTFDLDASEITTDHVALESDFLFIDAEHTNQAAFRDFLHICRFAKKSSIIAFHDAQYIFDALGNIEMLLACQKVKHKVYVIPDSVFVVLLGDFVDLAANVLSRFCLDKEAYFSNARKDLWKEIARNNAVPVT